MAYALCAQVATQSITEMAVATFQVNDITAGGQLLDQCSAAASEGNSFRNFKIRDHDAARPSTTFGGIRVRLPLQGIPAAPRHGPSSRMHTAATTTINGNNIHDVFQLRFSPSRSRRLRSYSQIAVSAHPSAIS